MYDRPGITRVLAVTRLAPLTAQSATDSNLSLFAQAQVLCCGRQA
ncbi:MAG TPA: hypothetical protein VJ808_12390 [Gemmatimonadales bacterium]|nr:hypothetical protein [Gemmatimonadales bacterium]